MGSQGLKRRSEMEGEWRQGLTWVVRVVRRNGPEPSTRRMLCNERRSAPVLLSRNRTNSSGSWTRSSSHVLGVTVYPWGTSPR